MKITPFRVLLTTILFSSLLTSCYNTKIAIGDAQPREAMIKVNSQRNHFLIGGLIPLNNAKSKASDLINEKENYIIRTNTTFVNGLVGFLTLMIYTPNTTTYYLPINDYLAEYKRYNPKKKYENDEDDDTPKKGFYFASERKPKKTRQPKIENEEEQDFEKVQRTQINPQPFIKKDNYVQDSQIPKYSEEKTTNAKVQASIDDYRATIYFKNGAKMDGIITESPNNNKVWIKLPNGSTVEAKTEDIDRIESK